MNLRLLLIECGRKSRTAQYCLYKQYAKRMFLLCRRYVRDDQVAEELLMNGFLKFFAHLDSFEYPSDEATEGWLTKIMVNEALKHLGDKTSFLLVPTDDLPEVEMEEDLTNRISTKEIYKAITELPTGYRTVFNLYVLENMSHKEIAELLQISEGTSKSQLSKAKQMLQMLLIKNNQDYGNWKTK